eukprot:TRINITY_DN935_c0_g1_i1.p2 TRINITY_DN935_c0_g1~~TRINITY_DN935_c0_g1_i1.p2  ORF type:complete len:116 (+),score=25.35 TRINITY_DN935_c0_g1_i1:131-478(+)
MNRSGRGSAMNSRFMQEEQDDEDDYDTAEMEDAFIQMLQKNMAKILEDGTTKCFNHCVPKPGNRLQPSERSCLENCTDRYRDALEVVRQAIGDQISKQANQTQGGAPTSLGEIDQ